MKYTGECSRCGACCKKPTLNLVGTVKKKRRILYVPTDPDLRRWAVNYGLPVSGDYIEVDLHDPKILITHTTPGSFRITYPHLTCIHLQTPTVEGGPHSCRIYDTRPQLCRDYPHTFENPKLPEECTITPC